MNTLNLSGYEVYQKNMLKGEGCHVTDSDGKIYIDFESGVWSLPLGHNNPIVNEVIIHQLSDLTHSGYSYSNPIVEEVAAQLLEVMNLPDGKCIYLSSGSEAVEFAVRLLKEVSNRPYLLKLEGHYLSAYGLSGDYANSQWISIDWNAHVLEGQADFDALINRIPFEDIAGFFFEPGNGSGVIKLPPIPFVQEIVKKVHAVNGFIVADEVTTGIGRTGKWFGYEHYGIQPDIICCGKGLGNGYPISAVGINQNLFQLLKGKNFLYSQSHQNDPLGCAVVKSVLDTISNDNLLENCCQKGDYIKYKLLEIKERVKCIKEIRGIGLMCTIQFNSIIDSDMLLEIHRRLFQEGYITGIKIRSKVLRFYPPLIIEYEMIDGMLEALEQLILTYDNDMFD